MILRPLACLLATLAASTAVLANDLPADPLATTVTATPGARTLLTGVPRPDGAARAALDPITTGNIEHGGPGAGPGAGTDNPDADAAAARVREGAAQPAQPYPAGEAHAALETGPAEAGHDGEGGQAWPTTRTPQPFDIMRTIQFLQDQVAEGNGRAIRVQALLLQRFVPVFLRADSESWKDPRNLRAALSFTLSGGPPEVLEGLIKAGAVDEAHRPFFDGAIAYVRNDLKKAETILAGTDAEALEPGLAAHLNLVLGQIRQTSDPKAAVVNLDRARLLMPGSLIEEAALRLQVTLVENLGDHETADRLARQYFDRYARSAYAANFRARFVAVFAERRGEAVAAMAVLDDLVDDLPDAQKREIYLGLARRGLVSGQLEMASLAAGEALATQGIAAGDLERARLYKIAATIGTEREAAVAEAVAGINGAQLQPEDLPLLEAAHSVVAEIDRSLDVARLESEAPAGTDAPSSAVVDRAQQLLNQVSDDLAKVQ